MTLEFSEFSESLQNPKVVWFPRIFFLAICTFPGGVVESTFPSPSLAIDSYPEVIIEMNIPLLPLGLHLVPNIDYSR